MELRIRAGGLDCYGMIRLQSHHWRAAMTTFELTLFEAAAVVIAWFVNGFIVGAVLKS
jgi:hypothetical protein